MFVVSETLYRARLWTVQTAFAQADGLTGSIFPVAPVTYGVWYVWRVAHVAHKDMLSRSKNR